MSEGSAEKARLPTGGQSALLVAASATVTLHVAAHVAARVVTAHLLTPPSAPMCGLPRFEELSAFQNACIRGEWITSLAMVLVGIAAVIARVSWGKWFCGASTIWFLFILFVLKIAVY